jgi:predicted amidohydrolase
MAQLGGLLQRYCAIARTHNLWLSLGGLQTALTADEQQKGGSGPAPSAALAAQHKQLNPGGQRIFNAHVVVDSKGQVVARYNKIHLFDVNIISGPSLCEVCLPCPALSLSPLVLSCM